MSNEQKECWLDYRHKDYSANVARWRFATDMYTGEVLDPGKISNYLVKKTQSECPEAFKERCDLADLTPHYSTLVDSLAGMLFNVEDGANRQFSDENGVGLGKIEDRDSIIGRLFNDADGRGTGWLTLWEQATIELVHSHRIWVLVDSPGGNAQVRIIPPSAVPNWRYDKEGLAEALVKEQTDLRTSIRDRPKDEHRYILFTREGWQRWKRVEDTSGKVSAIADGGLTPQKFEAPNGRPALAIFPVNLPMRRPVGWLMAKKANAIFNRESDRDTLLRTALFPFLNIIADDDLYEEIKKQIKEGTRLLQNDPENSGNHNYTSPDSGPATVSTDVLKRKVEEFYITGFREYGDSAKARTATEVRQDVSSGVGAFLQMLKAAVDDSENGALWRIEQVFYPNDRRKWFKCRVERSSNFALEDPQLLAEKLAARYVGKDEAVPVGPTALAHVVRQLASFDGVQLDEAEVDAAVSLFVIQQASESVSTLPIPAEVRADFALKLMEGLGYVDPEEEVETEGGGRKLKREELYEKALVIAQAQDRRDRDFLGGVGAFGAEE